MLPGDMGRTGRQWNVISEPYPGLRGYATAYSWNPLRKGLLTGIYVLPNSSRFFSMRFTPLNSRIFLHLNPKSHLLSNLKGRRLQIYLRPFSWLILRLPSLRSLRDILSQSSPRSVVPPLPTQPAALGLCGGPMSPKHCLRNRPYRACSLSSRPPVT